jgi:hypothetical protein
MQKTSELKLSVTPDVTLRIIGSIGVITAYFIILHVDVTTGVTLNLVADAISIPYFIRTKSWDVVIMIVFLLTISLSKIL